MERRSVENGLAEEDPQQDNQQANAVRLEQLAVVPVIGIPAIH